MEWLTSLWLPILASAAAVFVCSSVIWMALPIHKKDYRKLGGAEESIQGAIRSAGLEPGQYMFPACDPQALKDPAAQARWKAGPWGVLIVVGKPWSMGPTLGLWLLNVLILSAIVGYLAWSALGPGAPFARVFQVAGTAGLLAFGGNVMCDSIWKGRPWSLLPGALFDAVVYALVIGAIFGGLWPRAAGI
jgi:hypothetical protein